MILDKRIIFPHPLHAHDSGILAVGGDLSVERLLCAYQFGIFPWYSDDDPIVWWSPHERFVIFPEKVKVSKSMRSYFNTARYRCTVDQNFSEVLTWCKTIHRPDQGGTWITDEMREAYIAMYQQGYAHSVEVWEGDELVGGLYGVALGKIFFGESMFAKKSNASKFGLIYLCRKLHKLGYHFIDCQIANEHLISMGGENMSKEVFLGYLRKNCLQRSDSDFLGGVQDQKK